MKTVLIISGWAHGIEAIQPMGDALSDLFDVQLMTGSQVLKEQSIPDCDYIVTGSMGGLLAIEYLPESCKKLVLISSTAKFCATEDYSCGTHEKILKRMILQLKRNPEAVLNEFFKNVHFPSRESRAAIAARNVNIEELDDLVAGLEYLLNSDIRTKVPTLGIPVQIFHGLEDRIIPVEAAEWLHENVPDSQLKIYEGHGHALPAHQFGAIISAVSSFLNS
jgi:pimeloyl-[acyl-carrier protein] methyl ester esterase